MITIWHAFGVKGEQPWKAIYFLSTHLLIIYLATIIYYTVGILELRQIMAYLLIPYFSIKIVFQMLVWFNVFAKNEDLWEFVWSSLFIIVLLIGSIFLWKKLRRNG